MVFENLNWVDWSAITPVISKPNECAARVWSHKYDNRSKLHDTKFNYQLISVPYLQFFEQGGSADIVSLNSEGGGGGGRDDTYKSVIAPPPARYGPVSILKLLSISKDNAF